MCDANNVPACRSLIDSCGLYLEVNQPCIACTVAKRGAWVPSVPEQEGGGGSHVLGCFSRACGCGVLPCLVRTALRDDPNLAQGQVNAR